MNFDRKSSLNDAKVPIAKKDAICDRPHRTHSGHNFWWIHQKQILAKCGRVHSQLRLAHSLRESARRGAYRSTNNVANIDFAIKVWAPRVLLISALGWQFCSMDYFMCCESTCEQEARLTPERYIIPFNNIETVNSKVLSHTSSAVTFSTNESEEDVKYIYLQVWSAKLPQWFAIMFLL